MNACTTHGFQESQDPSWVPMEIPGTKEPVVDPSREESALLGPHLLAPLILVAGKTQLPSDTKPYSALPHKRQCQRSTLTVGLCL